MDTRPFGALHASWYDRWHHSKDYQSEVDQLGKVLAAEGLPGQVRVLDLGCGTGRHLELLAKAGHEVTGVDRSPVMVEQAARRLAGYGPRAGVVEADLTDLRLDPRFDATIMMFSVLGYHETDEAMFATLAAAQRHLVPDGLLLFDVLDGAVVLRAGALGGVSVVDDDNEGQLLRSSTGMIHAEEQVYETRMRLWLLEGDGVRDYVEESHRIRYFLPRELELILSMSGFALLGSEPLAGGAEGPTREWSRLVWARKAGQP